MRRVVALVVAAGLVAASCSSATEFGNGSVASTDPVTSASGATAVAEPTLAAALSEDSEPSETDPGAEEEADVEGEEIGAPDVSTSAPETQLTRSLRTVGAVGDVVYTAPTSERTLAIQDGRSPLTGFTPDGQRSWVRLPSGQSTCPEDTLGTRLGLVNTRTGDAEPLDEQNDGLLDIVKIHEGPNGQVLLEYSCGKYGGPAGLARMGTDGSLTDFRSINGLGDHLWMWQPRWGWSQAGEPIVIIPIQGQRKTAIDAYVRVDTGDVIEKIATDVVGQVELAGFHDIKIVARSDGGEGRRVMLNGESVWAGVIWEYASDEHQMVIVGPYGGLWIRVGRSWNEPTVTELQGDLSSVALAPNGEVIALAGETGTGLINKLGELTLLHDQSGQHLAFSQDGTQLSIVQFTSVDDQPTTTLERIWEFAPADVNEAAIVPGSVLSSAGLGPLRVGMTISEIEAATGHSFTVDSIGDFGAGECFWGYADDLVGVSVIGEAQSTNPGDAIVMAVSVTSPLYPTPSGVRVGDSTDKVLELFPDQIDVLPHTYSNGTYLDYLPADEGEQTSVRFETLPGGQVSETRGGIIAWTRLVEGCA